MYYGPARRRRIRPRNIIILAVAIAAGVIVLLSFLGVLPSFTTGTVHELQYSLPNDAMASQHGILFNQNDTLKLIDKDGSEQWSLNLELSESKTVASEDLILNYSGKALSLMRYTKEQLFSTSLSTDILGAAVGKNTVAILTSAPSETGEDLYYIQMFNTAGEQISLIDTFSTRQVVDFGYYGEDLFWALQLDTSGVVPEAWITTHKQDGSMTANITITDEIVEDVYLTDSTIYASGTGTLSSHSYFGVKNTDQQIYGWRPEAQSILPQSLYLAYVPRSKGAEIDAARIYSGDLAHIPVRLPRNVFSLAITQTRLYAFTDEVIYTYTLDGTASKEITLKKPIVRAKQLSDSYAVLWDNQKSYVMELN